MSRGNVKCLEIAAKEAGPRCVETLRKRNSSLQMAGEQLRLLGKSRLVSGLCDSVDFDSLLAAAGWPEFKPARLEFFQINLGKLCNMSCRHCHVDAGPDRTDAVMSLDTIQACLQALDRTAATTVDLTGGAPELNPHFEYLVDSAIARGKHVIDRCNLTVLLLPQLSHLPQYFAEHGVEVVCSLPHFRPRNTDAQRGEGTFERSIQALRALNQAGYGQGDPKRTLTLMVNPAGAFLTGDQASLERDWRSALARDHDVSFDRLIALNNMPIGRFLEWLVTGGEERLEQYLQRLVDSFNPAAVAGIMCRNTVSVAWNGLIYDCDFNQILELPPSLDGALGRGQHIRDFDLGTWQQRRIKTARHCLGCTAGAGSSCGGSTA